VQNAELIDGHLDYLKTYQWYVNVTDYWGATNTSELFNFTTEGLTLGLSDVEPVNGSETPPMRDIPFSFRVTGTGGDYITVRLYFDGTLRKTWTNTTDTTFDYDLGGEWSGEYNWTVNVTKRYWDDTFQQTFVLTVPAITYVDLTIGNPFFWMVFFAAIWIFLLIISEWKQDAAFGIIAGLLGASIGFTYWIGLDLLTGLAFGLLMGAINVYIVALNIGRAVDYDSRIEK